MRLSGRGGNEVRGRRRFDLPRHPCPPTVRLRGLRVASGLGPPGADSLVPALWATFWVSSRSSLLLPPPPAPAGHPVFLPEHKADHVTSQCLRARSQVLSLDLEAWAVRGLPVHTALLDQIALWTLSSRPSGLLHKLGVPPQVDSGVPAAGSLPWLAGLTGLLLAGSHRWFAALLCAHPPSPPGQHPWGSTPRSQDGPGTQWVQGACVFRGSITCEGQTVLVGGEGRTKT